MWWSSSGNLRGALISGVTVRLCLEQVLSLLNIEVSSLRGLEWRGSTRAPVPIYSLIPTSVDWEH